MERIYTVAELTGFVKSYIEASPQLKSVSVKGELSNVSAPSGRGHVFFTLKDKDAVLRAVMFKSRAERLSFKPENGMTVICNGRISVYPAGGQYLLYADSITVEGEGNLFIALEQLKKKLAAEGLFDTAKKKRLPKIPMRVGVITSATGAAVQDIINVAGRRFPAAEIVLYPSLVQGAGAAEMLASGVRYFNQRHPVDVIIIGRGGGSVEELWEFNGEVLVRAIAASHIPVVSAVGHETDFTLCDFAADLRAPTPSAAAEIVFPDKADILRRFENARNRMSTLILQRISGERRVLAALAASPALRSPTAGFDDKRLRIADLADRMESSARTSLALSGQGVTRLGERLETATVSRLKLTKMRISALKEQLLLLDPLSVLERGYAAIFDTEGNAVTAASSIKKGSSLTLRLADGAVKATADEVELWKK
ncbi:MAG: exodeoxyribonuclease VII large subunit [Clostridia bacterium]|nr:exodeoxyribonuclease VII large subunit [Clostridia bacterium]